MPPDPISDFLLSIGIKPLAFVGALMLSCVITACVAVAILQDDIPRKR